MFQPTGWWPFNGNGVDSSGNGNNGTVSGATLTTDRFGNSGRSFYFDGSGDSISVINLPQCTNYTISAWFKCDSLATPYPIIFNQKTNLENNRLQLLGVGYPSSSIGKLFTGDDQNGNLYISTNRVDDGVWHFVCVVYNHQAGSMKMYVDGLLNGTSPIPSASTFGGRTHFGNGFTQFVNPPPNDSKGFFGNLDDIGIWNRPLTQQEITNLYNASTTPPPCPTIPVNLQRGLVGYWPFCGNASDASGNGNNGTVNGATLTADRFGNWNNAYNFDGVNDYISVNNSASLQSNQASISAWVKLDTLVSWFPNRYIVTKGCNNPNTGNGGTYRIFFDVRNYVCDNWVNNDNNSRVFLLSNNSFFNPEWCNIIFTYDGSKNRLFINGIQIDSATQSGNLTSNADPLLFGTRLLTFTGSNCQLTQYFKGAIDDITIWNRALSTEEISQFYQTQSSAASNGNVGVNIIVPQRNLHVKDVIRIEPRNTPPDNPAFGDMYIDATLKKLRVYDGTT